FLRGVGAQPDPDYAATIPQQTFMIYQLMFAIITPALISGAFAERMKFSAMVLFMVLWSLFVYAPMAHMVWGKGGLLNASLGGRFPTLDFAGGTVVHITSGVSALICATYLGRRLGCVHGGLGVQFFLRPRAVLQLRQARFHAGYVGAPGLQIRRQTRPLELHRGPRLRQLRFARRQARRLAFPLRHQLIAVQAGDDLPLFHRVALVHCALRQPPGGLERDGDFVQLHVAGKYEAVIRRLSHPANRPNRRPGGRQDHYDNQNSFSHM